MIREEVVYIKNIEGKNTVVTYKQGKLVTDNILGLPKKLNDKTFSGTVSGIIKDDMFFAYKSNNDIAAKNWESVMCDLLWLETNKFTVPEYKFYEHGEDPSIDNTFSVHLNKLII